MKKHINTHIIAVFNRKYDDMVQKCNYIVPSKVAFKQDRKVTMF